MPILQFKVPQNVQREDKIVAFLTLKQLIICMVGGGIAYFIYISLAKTYYAEVWMPPVIVISIITVAIAFLKINDVTFMKFLFLTVEYWILPRRRVWIQGAGDPLRSAFETIASKQKHEKKSEKKQAHIKPTIEQLDEITKILDTHGVD